MQIGHWTFTSIVTRVIPVIPQSPPTNTYQYNLGDLFWSTSSTVLQAICAVWTLGVVFIPPNKKLLKSFLLMHIRFHYRDIEMYFSLEVYLNITSRLSSLIIIVIKTFPEYMFFCMGKNVGIYNSGKLICDLL